MLNISKIHLEYMNQPMGVTRLPQLGWVIESNKENVKQAAYHLQLALEPSFSHLLKDSGWIDHEDSAHVLMEDMVLQSARKYYVRVEVKDNYGEQSNWSEPVFFVTGLVQPDQWQGVFVTGETGSDASNSKGTYVRGAFEVTKAVKEAFVYASALGLYGLHLNGEKVGLEVMAPGWTSYHKRLLYQTYEITEMLVQGTNVLGAHLGAGWYKGLMGLTDRRNNYGERTAFIGEVHIHYTDGTKDVVATNEKWMASDSPVLFSEIYDGEVYDATLEQKDWCTRIADIKNWRAVETIQYPKECLFNQIGSTVKEIEIVSPKAIMMTSKNETVIDFGQNLAGWVEFQVEGEKGDIVEIHCFETLDAAGNVYKDNLRKAKQKLYYTCAGNAIETYKPHFTYQGFRYAQIVQYPGSIELDQFLAYAVHSEMDRTGYFECSNPDINQLQSNVLWGMKSNFLDVPTDCPQRDERLGWTGDAQIFCRTASFLMNTHQFFSKWLLDLAADQTPEGGVTHVVPDILTGVSEGNWLLSQGTHSAAAWSDAAVINPWVLFLTFGDLRIVEDQYASMKAWIDFMTAHADQGIWSYQLQFGDWVALDAEEGSFFGATPTDLTASAYYAYSTRLFAKMAKAIGKIEDYEAYHALSHEIVKGFQQAFFDEEGDMKAMTQTAHVVALYFDLTPENYKERTVARLVQLIEKEGGHLVTGFIGTPYICHALSQNGRVKEAYELLLKEDLPSWLYQVKMGATTIWEHWDGLKPDGTMWSPGMNSFNHYAYGAIGEWLYRVVAGIEIDENQPGYKHILIQPVFGGGLTYVKASYHSVYGEITVRWDIEGNQGKLMVSIPPNTSARVLLREIKAIDRNNGLCFEQEGDGYYTQIGSGAYTINFMV